MRHIKLVRPYKRFLAHAYHDNRYLVVGLGNPGKAYQKTRHNIGFMCLDYFQQAKKLEETKKYQSLYSETMIGDKEVIFVKPQTFMNASGSAVKAVAQAFDVAPTNCLVIYDTIHLPLGRLRVRPGGGAGGQKGMADIQTALRNTEIPQLRIGMTSHVDFVLGAFEAEERDLLPLIYKTALKVIESWLSVGMKDTMQDFNGITLSPPK